MNTTDIKERVEFLLRRENLEDVRSISMDGSAFDSNQNRFVQERVDCEFVRQYSPRLLQILERCSVELQWNCDFTQLHKCIVEAMMELNLDVFVPTPGVRNPHSPSLSLYR